MKPSTHYSIVIPVYNSSHTLPKLDHELQMTMRQVYGQYEVIYVDDCSTDNSWQIMASCQQKHPQVRIIRLGDNVGQWMATLAGISRTRGKTIITMDDDLEYDTNDILRLIEFYENNPFYVVFGIPEEKTQKNLSYKLFFNMRNWVLHMFFGKQLTESFKIFTRNIYFDQHDQMLSTLHFEAHITHLLSPHFIGYMHVSYRPYYAGESRHTLWMKIRILIHYGMEYFTSPYRLVLYSAMFLILMSSGFILADVLAQWIHIFFLILMALFLLIAGVSGKYLSHIYFRTKGLPEYLIVEEY